MKIEIDFTKSVQENANDYYGRVKKARRKLLGLKHGEAELKKKLASGQEVVAEKVLVKKRSREWYEKFHWFFTSEGFLVIAGRDAKSNEAVVKKIMEKNDLYFHADVHGAPHTVIKAGGKNPGDASKREAAVFAAVFSKAWREQLPAVDVYSALPEQVSKKAPTGESMGTGAFMVYGQREWFKKTPLELSIGFRKKGDSYELHAGPKSAVMKNTDFFVGVSFGNDSKGDASKRVRGIFSKRFPGMHFSLDDISSLLPSGGLKVGD